MGRLDALLIDIRACRKCVDEMSHDPNPVLQVSVKARVAIFGQAPGNLAHQSGRPFTDPSGARLREWLHLSDDKFYDAEKLAIVPMGFCFPGYDKNGGDLPPLKQCVAEWRAPLMEALPNLELCILVGGYAQKWYLGDRAEKTLTATVANWRAYGPRYFPTPHPSWRNNGWLKKNQWFENELLPVLRKQIRRLI